MPYPEMYIDDSHVNLTQGDVFSRFETKLLPRTDPEELGFMVLTYTCDLVNRKNLSFIHICPVFSIEVIIADYIDINKERSEENLRKGLKDKIYDISQFIPRNYFFLAPNPVFNNLPAYAEIGQIWNLPIEYYDEIKSNRLVSLFSPWREKLGWKLGYLFNRIALEDVKKEEIESFIDNNEVLIEFLKSK